MKFSFACLAFIGAATPSSPCKYKRKLCFQLGNGDDGVAAPTYNSYSYFQLILEC